MRNCFYLFIFLICNNQYLFPNKFELTPIIVNFQGVESKNNMVIAYGDYGSILISYNAGEEWAQKKIFNRGTIIKTFLKGDTLIAFNNIGDIGISYDIGMNWNLVKQLDDSILAVTNYSYGYFLRSRDKLFTIDDDFRITAEIPLLSKFLTSLNPYILPNYNRSLIYFKDYLIAETDSANFIRFTLELKPVDTLSLVKLGIFDSMYVYASGYCLDVDSTYLYFRVIASQKSKPNVSGVLKASVYITDDFTSTEKYIDFNNPLITFKIFNNQFESLNKLDPNFYDTNKLTIPLSNFSYHINDFTISGDNKYIVGNNKIIEIFNLKDSSLKVISEFSNKSLDLTPIEFDSNTYLFFTGTGGNEYSPYIYKTDNNGITIKPTVDNINDSIYQNRFSTYKFHFKYYDEKNNKIMMGGSQPSSYAQVFTSYDTAQTFSNKQIQSFVYQEFLPFYFNALSFPNLQIMDDFFVTSGGSRFGMDGKTIYFNIFTFNKNFELISLLMDSNFVMDYVFSTDTNTFLIHGANAIDSTSEIRFTSNKGKNWEIIKKYPIAETLNYYKEFEKDNEKYLALIHLEQTIEFQDTNNYTQTVHKYLLDIINLQTNELINIAEWRNPDNSTEWGHYSVNFEYDKNMFYIGFEDTLFYTNNIYNKSQWDYMLLPNNGKIVRPLKKFSDKLFCRYKDNDISWSNDIFWIKIPGITTSIIDIEKNQQNYLYCFPPYPNPATNIVRANIYWDTSIDIENDDIAVYDIFGNKVVGKEKIIIDKQNAYSGFLSWDCTNVPDGIYLIRIIHGTKTWSLKVIVIR